ncbi:sulfide-quinone reductase [Sulfobacillus acidophilus TPY]|uniref:Sulfide-quinone oxidoreductase n=1 Tax=Sulfobacillus acidophilus (strain ATCC 700253 / DSM 10332 / NAL) TaxID=679936 RepID=G8TTV1_SULAD|nr:sulfide-quinone reductase [Sulfobacillus acidophilus TPY]AEW06860.1 sulfide-quinone oxidoreductase [Sulfobacillus acidophilus DSM 10332]
MPDVVVLGSGFAGLTAALSIRRGLGRQAGYRVVVIAKDAQFVYRPALVDVAFGHKPLDDIRFALEPIYRRAGIEWMPAVVTDVDPDQRQVKTSSGTVSYDKLVVALGERFAYDEVPGLKDYGLTVCSVEGTLKLQTALRQYTGGPAVVGWAQNCQTGGPAFEVALELHHYLETKQLQGPMTFVDPLPKFWAPAGERASRYLEQLFNQKGITRLGPVTVRAVEADRVILDDGRELPSRLTIITPPFRGDPALSRLAHGHPRGWIETGKDMRSVHDPDVYVAGNATAFEGPKQGHTAMLQAEVVAANLVRDLVGRPEARRQYHHEMSCVLNLGNGRGLYVRRSLWDQRHRTVKLGRQWPLAKKLLEYLFVHTPVFREWGVPITWVTR